MTPRRPRRPDLHEHADHAGCAPRRRSSRTPVADDRGDEGDADHRDLRQGRHRQVVHAGQPQLHDGAAGQAGAADRLRPEERHHLAAVRRQGLPDHHRDLARRRSWPARRSQIGDVCFKRDGVFAMELGGPEVGRGCGGRGIIHGFELLEKLGFHDWDFDYVLLDFLGDVVCGGFGLPIARDMCQKVIVVGSQRPAVALRRQQRLLGGASISASSAAMSASPAWSSTRTTARARPRPSPRPSASRCWPPSRPTRTSAARARTTRSSARRRAAGAPLFAGAGRRTSPTRRRCTRRRSTQDGLLGLFSADETGARLRAGAGDRCRHARQALTPAASLEVVYDDA